MTYHLVRPVFVSAIFRKIHVRVRVRVRAFKNFHVRVRVRVRGFDNQKQNSAQVTVKYRKAISMYVADI